MVTFCLLFINNYTHNTVNVKTVKTFYIGLDNVKVEDNISGKLTGNSIQFNWLVVDTAKHPIFWTGDLY